jgi:hypothetical protein
VHVVEGERSSDRRCGSESARGPLACEGVAFPFRTPGGPTSYEKITLIPALLCATAEFEKRAVNGLGKSRSEDRSFG